MHSIDDVHRNCTFECDHDDPRCPWTDKSSCVVCGHDVIVEKGRTVHLRRGQRHSAVIAH
jgi:hypothetical protein